jgi:hypothetical protein
MEVRKWGDDCQTWTAEAPVVKDDQLWVTSARMFKDNDTTCGLDVVIWNNPLNFRKTYPFIFTARVHSPAAKCAGMEDGKAIWSEMTGKFALSGPLGDRGSCKSGERLLPNPLHNPDSGAPITSEIRVETADVLAGGKLRFQLGFINRTYGTVDAEIGMAAGEMAPNLCQSVFRLGPPWGGPYPLALPPLQQVRLPSSDDEWFEIDIPKGVSGTYLLIAKVTPAYWWERQGATIVRIIDSGASSAAKVSWPNGEAVPVTRPKP